MALALSHLWGGTHTQKKGEIMNVVAQHTLTTRELGSLKGKILSNFNRESVNVLVIFAGKPMTKIRNGQGAGGWHAIASQKRDRVTQASLLIALRTDS